MSLSKKLLILKTLIVIIFASSAYADSNRSCMNGNIATIKHNTTGTINVTKRYDLKAGSQACFGDPLELKIIDVSKDSITASLKTLLKSKNRQKLKKGDLVHFQDFLIKYVSSDKKKTARLQIIYRVKPKVVFPFPAAPVVCSLAAGPICYFDSEKHFTGFGLCSNEVPAHTMELYTGAC